MNTRTNLTGPFRALALFWALVAVAGLLVWAAAH